MKWFRILFHLGDIIKAVNTIIKAIFGKGKEEDEVKLPKEPRERIRDRFKRKRRERDARRTDRH